MGKIDRMGFMFDTSLVETHEGLKGLNLSDLQLFNFIKLCFNDKKIFFNKNIGAYDFGMYEYNNFMLAFEKFKSECVIFHYNCIQCHFPKFKDKITEETEDCPECGD